MDDSGFDSLVRALASPSRRAIFSALTATLFGRGLGLSADKAEGKRKQRKHGKPDKRSKRTAHDDNADAVQGSSKKKKRKKKKKAPTATSPMAPPTPPPSPVSCDGVTCAPVPNGFSFCQNGQCVIGCINGTSLCGTRCVDMQTDPTNCGTCGTPCTGEGAATCGNTGRCVAGACEKDSSDGEVCGGACVDTQTDPNHCGTCGNACLGQGLASCGNTGRCVAGVCETN